MKIKFTFLIALVAMLAFSSCEDDVLDITETFEYETEMTIFTTDTVMMSVEVVDMTDQSSIINDYKDKIESIEITEIKYWLTSHEGDDDQEIIEASIKVAAADGSGEELISSLQNQILSNLVGEDNAIELPVEQAGIDRMASLMKNDPYTFKLISNTACNKGPLDFTVKLKFEVKLIANPL